MKVEIAKAAKALLVERIRSYFDDELDQEIGALPAELLLDFMSELIGPYHYNQGLRAAHQTFIAKMDDVADAVYLLEKPVEERR